MKEIKWTKEQEKIRREITVIYEMMKNNKRFLNGITARGKWR